MQSCMYPVAPTSAALDFKIARTVNDSKWGKIENITKRSFECPKFCFKQTDSASINRNNGKFPLRLHFFPPTFFQLLLLHLVIIIVKVSESRKLPSIVR